MDLCYTTTWDSGIGSKHLRRLLIFVILCSLLLIKEINESESIALYPDICHIVFQTGILRLDFFFFFFLPRLNVCTTKILWTAKLFASILIIVYRKNFISARIKKNGENTRNRDPDRVFETMRDTHTAFNSTTINRLAQNICTLFKTCSL